MMGKRIKGIKDNKIDIAKSIAKRTLKIGSKEAEKRLSICNGCENRVVDELFGGYMCELCFCPLKNLAYSDKGCDANKW